MSIVTVQARQVCVRLIRRAERAACRGIDGRRREVASGLGDIGLHVLGAGLPGRWVEMQVLYIGTFDGRVGQASREHAVHEVSEWGDAVHEDPEAWQGSRRGEDAVEDEGQREHELGNVAAAFCTLDAGDDHVGKGRCEE